MLEFQSHRRHQRIRETKLRSAQKAHSQLPHQRAVERLSLSRAVRAPATEQVRALHPLRSASQQRARAIPAQLSRPLDRAEPEMRLKPLLLLFATALSAAVPTPKDHFGHDMGADRFVLDWDKVVSYFRAVEKESPRVRVQELGKTAEGRPLIAAFIAAPDTIQNLNRYIEIQKKLADPRLTPLAELEPLIAKRQGIGLITCSIHSTPLASTRTAHEFA